MRNVIYLLMTREIILMTIKGRLPTIVSEDEYLSMLMFTVRRLFQVVEEGLRKVRATRSVRWEASI